MTGASRLCHALVAVALLPAAFAAPAGAAEPFRLTTVFDIGGGGCVGETRVYEESALAAMRGASAADAGRSAKAGPAPADALAALANARSRHFLTTVGCSADRVAISLDGNAYLLDSVRIEALGIPATYTSDTAPSARVRIEKLATLRAIEFRQSECTQSFDKVRVHIEFKGATRVVPGIAINSCP